MIKPELMLCHKQKLLIDALGIIKKNGKGLVFIVDDFQKVVGILSDGDVRTALLNGAELQDLVSKVMNADFVKARDTATTEELLRKVNQSIKIIPLVDDKGRYVSYFEYSQQISVPVATPDLGGNELKYLTDAFLSTWISSTGQYITKFENAFAKFCHTKYAVAVSNGTTALHVSLVALGIGPGDEVIVPDLTFAATINVVLHCQATPVIVDVNETDWCIDPQEIEKAITSKTKAIIPVHLYGQPANLAALKAIAKKYNLFMIEDAAEAHGATFNNKPVGSWGDVGCFSFYGNKVLTTGEGGMCVTNSKKIADRIRKLRDHGMSKTKRYWHDVVGFNYRMTNLQAAIGLAQLERITDILDQRRTVEKRYIEALRSFKVLTFQAQHLPKRRKITWLVSCLIKPQLRAAFMKALKQKGIDSRPFFYPLSAMPLYKKYVFSSRRSQKLSHMGLNFPTGNDINDVTLLSIAQVLKNLSQ